MADLQEWYQKMSEGMSDMGDMGDTSQEDFVKSQVEHLPDSVRLAVVLDGMGFNMDRVQEDGSYSVSGNDLAFGEGQALGIFSESGELDTGKAMALLDTGYDDMSEEQRKALDDVTFVNQKVMDFAKTSDGQMLADTEDGQKLGDFLEKIDGVDDLEAYQDGNFFTQKKTAADIVTGAMKNQDALQGATIVLDADTMAQFKQYQETMQLAKDGQLTSDFVNENAGLTDAVPEEPVQEDVVENEGSDVSIDESVSDAVQAAGEGMNVGVNAGLAMDGADGTGKTTYDAVKDAMKEFGTAGLGAAGLGSMGAAGSKLADILPSGEEVREKLHDLKEDIYETMGNLREKVQEYSETLSERSVDGDLQAMQGSQIGADVGLNAMDAADIGRAGASVVSGVMATDGLSEDMENVVEDIQSSGEEMTSGAMDASGLVSDIEDRAATIMEGEVVDSEDVQQAVSGGGFSYNNQGDTNITINIGADMSGMSMVDMARMQMEGMGIDMSDEKNPEIPEWFGEMQEWMEQNQVGADKSDVVNLPYNGQSSEKAKTLEMPPSQNVLGQNSGKVRSVPKSSLSNDGKVRSVPKSSLSHDDKVRVADARFSGLTTNLSTQLTNDTEFGQ